MVGHRIWRCVCVPDPSGDKMGLERQCLFKHWSTWHLILCSPTTLFTTINSVPRPFVILACSHLFCCPCYLKKSQVSDACLTNTIASQIAMLFMASTRGTIWEQVCENFLTQDLNWSCAVIYLIIKIREGNSPLFVIKHTVLPLGRKLRRNLYTCSRH